MTLLSEHFILLVDDEQSITKSLQRPFQNKNTTVGMLHK